jgi:ceramide glucosyltransferase
VLKPLSGLDAGLEQNLESFFVQDHPDYEIVFGVEDAGDPAVPVVRSLMAHHPEVPATLVIHTVPGGVNPKVRNLRGMIEHAAHDCVVVSDSNIRVTPHYLSELCAEYEASDHVGLVTSLVRGVDEDGIGAGLESVQLAGFCAAGIAGPTLVGEALVMGKSMMFSRRALEALGGLGALSNVLAEDYVMGKMFQHAGYSVRIAKTGIDNVVTRATVRSFVARSRRWAMLRFRLRPLAYVIEPIASPLAMIPFVWAVLGPWALAWALAMLALRDVGQWLLLSGMRRAWIPFLLAPVREALALFAWVQAPFRRHVAWRGKRVRLSSGSVAYASASSPD